MATIASLFIKLGVQDDASAGFKKVEKSVDSAAGHVKTFSNNVGEAKESIVGHLGKIVAAAGITGAAFEGAEFVKGGIEAAEGLAKAHESLTTAIEKTGGSVKKLDPILEQAAKGAADYGISQEQATKSLAQATLMTGSAEAGQRAYKEAVLLSKGAHISFDAALRATAKGQDGVTSGLTRYGVIIKKGASGVAQLAAIQKVWGGQAAANTLDSDRLNAKFQNMQASLGSFLLPYFLRFAELMGDAIDGLQSLAKWVGKNSDIIAPLAAAIGSVVLAFTLWKAATAAWTMATELATGAQEALNLAMSANPIGIVILALVALGAALAVLWLKSEKFRDIVTGALDDVKGAAKTVADFFMVDVPGAFDHVLAWLRGHWPEIATIISGPFAPIVALATNAFGVRSALEGAMDAVEARFRAVFGILGSIVNGAVKGVDAGVHALEAVFNPVLSVLHDIEKAAGDAADAVSRVEGSAGKVGGIVGKAGGFLGGLIPGHAMGGTNLRGGMALVGEYGPELVNLPGGSDIYTHGQTSRMLSKGLGRGGDVYVENMTVNSGEDARLLAYEMAVRLGG
jgi:phage-related protein